MKMHVNIPLDTLTPKAESIPELDMIRLKFHGLPEDKGPDILMSYDLTREVIKQLQSALPESLVKEVS